MEFLADAPRWQRALSRHGGTFACLAQGSRIGLVAEDSLGSVGRAGAQMLVWTSAGGELRVDTATFPGFEQTDVDIVMAADEGAIGIMSDALDSDVLAAMRRLIREGRVLFFARKARQELEDAGYEDLLEQLGFVFMGACR